MAFGEGKYGTPEAFAKKLHPGEPWFAIRAQDANAVPTLLAYAIWLHYHDGNKTASDDIVMFAKKFEAWQTENPDKVKPPD
jgi:hypothetical protein